MPGEQGVVIRTKRFLAVHDSHPAVTYHGHLFLYLLCRAKLLQRRYIFYAKIFWNFCGFCKRIQKSEVSHNGGQIDILLNIAGGNMPGATLEPEQHFYDMDISCWEKVTNLNMNGTVYPSMIFGKVMAKQGKGCIINVSSMAAYSAITRVPGYSAAKTAVANFTQWLASEMALKYGDGIRVNAIAPGFFIGDQNRRVLINPDGSLTDRSKKVLAKTPMKRFGDIKELNGAVHFLCSEAASFVTGAMLPIDGGFSAFSGV